MKLHFLLITILLITLGFAGCGEDKISFDQALPGEEASEYEALVDMEFWMNKFDIDDLTKEMYDEERILVEGAIDVLGYENLRQTEKKATISDGMVYASSTVKYDGDEDDDSFYASMLGWEPGNADLITGFDPGEAYGIIAMGNPTGYIDFIVPWVTDSGALKNFLGDMSEEMDEFAEMNLAFNLAKMTIKGYWYTAQEDYYPFFGDELVIALYENKNFIGWEDMAYADSFEEGSPLRLIIAIETGEPGIADELKDAIDYYTDMFDEMINPRYSYYEDEEEDVFKIETKKVGGNKIYYFDIEDAIQIGWTEYKGALFISDLTTLENIGDYYDTSKKVKDLPGEYNGYMTINIDKLRNDFFNPFAREIKDEMEGMEDYVDEEIYEMYENVLDYFEDGDLGTIQVISVFGGDEVNGRLVITRDMADLMLLGHEFLLTMVDKEFEMMEDSSYIDRYFDLYGNNYNELRKLPPPELKEPGEGVMEVPQ